MRKSKKFITFIALVLMVTVVFVGCSSDTPAPGNNEAEVTEAWPQGNLNIIVGYGPGGSTDTFARIVAKYLKEKTGQAVVVTNVEGGGGAVGYTQTLTSKPDGNTVVVSNGSLMTLGGAGNVDFGYEDFDNLARVVVEEELVVVGKDAPWNNVNELVEYAKENPGNLKVGFAGMGGFTHLAASQFLKSVGIEVEGVGYGSGSEAVAGLLGGFVDMIVQQPGEVYAQYEAEELKILALMGEERTSFLEGIPTLKEEGIDLVLNQWRGLSAPKGIPEAAKEGWINVLDKIQQNPEFQKEVQEVLLANTNCIAGDEFEGWLKSEADWIYPLIEELGLKAQ